MLRFINEISGASFTNICVEMFLLCARMKCLRKITVGFMTHAFRPAYFVLTIVRMLVNQDYS